MTENKNHSHENKIVIRDIPAITEAMFASEIKGRKTLAEFITSDCLALAVGQINVYSTQVWNYFAHLKENRPINETHVQALDNSFVKDGYQFTVVYVNEKLEMIDGQHRFEAAKRRKLPVYFTIMPGWGIKEVTILNVNSKNWTIGDFMETHAKSGNPNYMRFKEFYDAHDFDVTICQLLITGKRSGGNSTDAFRLGQLQVDDQQITDAYLKAKKIMQMQAFHPVGYKSRHFVDAMLTLLKTKGYDHEHLIAKLEIYPEMILIKSKTLRVDEYLMIFNDKYNFRRLKEKISFNKR